MKIVVSGASGLVGSTLVRALEGDGHQALRLVRRPPRGGTGEAVWDPARGILDPAVLSGADAVINLNGRSIAAGRWSEAVKAELRSSRLESTRTIGRAIAAASEAPPLLLSASATGFYGDRGEELVDESAVAGTGFLAELAHDWEAAAVTATSERTRVVLLRLGMVVSGKGGALQKMLLPFRLGLGGPVGSGRQFWPWIGIGDVVGAIRFVLATPTISGPVNLVAPQETRCKDFTSTLGRVLGRPAFLPAPAAALKLALGEMADALLLASTRVRPRALLEAGYTFEHPTLEEALRSALGRGDQRSIV